MAEDKVTPKKAVKKAAKPAAKKVVKKAAKPAAKPAAKAAVKKATAKPATSTAPGKISITLIRSKHGRLASHKACVAGLGLRRMHQTVEVIDTPENRGMINKVQYLLNVKEA